MYVEYSIEKYTYEDGSEADYGGIPIHIKIGKIKFAHTHVKSNVY